MKMTEAELFEQFGRTAAENAMLRREVERLRAEIERLGPPPPLSGSANGAAQVREQLGVN